MPKLSASRNPKLCLHKPDRAYVEFPGMNRIYVGGWETEEARSEHARLVALWNAGGRVPFNPGTGGSAETCQNLSTSGPTVGDLSAAYWQWAQGYYRKNGKPTDEIYYVKAALAPLGTLFTDLPAASFGPKHLVKCRDVFVERLSRKGCNRYTGMICTVFRWASEPKRSDEWNLPPHQYHSLRSVRPLKPGRTTAPETEAVPPASDMQIDAVRPFLSRIVRTMVDVQRFAGMRPTEVCLMRGQDIDRTADVWLYTPHTHKTEHHGKVRVVAIGPKAQAVLSPFLLGRNLEAYLFDPREAVAEKLKRQRESRKTKVQPSQQDRRKTAPKRQARERYDDESYGQAIGRAWESALLAHLTVKRPGLLPSAEKAVADVGRLQSQLRRAKDAGETPAPEIDRLRAALKTARAALAESLEKAAAVSGFPNRFAPNQLRHAAAEEIDLLMGRDTAWAALGHSSTRTTAAYTRDVTIAMERARRLG